MKKRSFIIVIAAFVTFVVIAGSIFFNISQAHASPEWMQIGKGNLSATKNDGKWELNSSPATYINMLGVSGKEYKLMNNDAYELNSDNLAVDKPQKVAVQKCKITDRGSDIADIIIANGKVFNASEQHSQYLADGRLLVNDYSNYKNIWLVDKQAKATSLLDESDRIEADKVVNAYNKSSDTKVCTVWAYNANVAGKGDEIVFNSNRDTIMANKYPFNMSVYSVNTNDKTPKLIMDASKYGDTIILLGTAGDIVSGYVQSSSTLIVYNLSTDDTSTFTLQGIPVSLSPNGHSVLFRKVVDNYLQKDFYVFDTQTGTEKFIGMPDGYFYNEVGSWSLDGSKFAFYMNGLKNNDPQKSYRTNIKIGVVDVDNGTLQAYEKPASANLYPLGSISWIEDKYVTAYTDDDQTWALKIK